MELQNDLKNDSQARQQVLRQLLREGTASTQEDIVIALRQKKYDVTQSTISRDLRRVGAIKTTNNDGQIVYRLPDTTLGSLPPTVSHNLGGLLVEIKGNESLIVIRTSPGSASLVARHLDNQSSLLGILGTIAGDDTIFIAPSSTKKIPALIRKIKEEF